MQDHRHAVAAFAKGCLDGQAQDTQMTKAVQDKTGTVTAFTTGFPIRT